MSKIDVSQWGEFKVGDLFERVKTKKVPFKALDLPQESNSVQSIPLVAAGIDSQGRNRYIEPKYVTIIQNCLTVSANGANSGAVFYQNSEFSILQDAYALQLVDMYKKYRVQNIYLFLTSVLTNVLVNNNWTNKATWRKVQDKEIYLPITSDGKPNWEYMDNYIAELAARSHKDVSSFNQVKPKSYKINIDNWKKFKVGDLFERVSLSFHGNGIRKDYISEVQDDTHQLPLLGAKKGNNGIVYYGDSTVFDSIDKCIGIVQNGAASAGLVYPECDSFGVYTDAYAIKLKNGSELTNESILFVSAVLQKLLFSKYSYYNKCTWSKVQFDTLQLPVNDDGQPDFNYMAKYIEMMQVSAQYRLQNYQNVDK